MKSLHRMLWSSFLCIICGAPYIGFAQAHQDVAGEWTLSLGKRTLMVLSLHAATGPSLAYNGALARPTHLTTADAVSFSGIGGPTEVDPVTASSWKASTLSITVQSPGTGEKTTYLLTPQDTAHAELRIEGVPLPAMTLTRAAGPSAVSTDWRVEQTYSLYDDAPSNPEMKRIFQDDQRARQAWPNIDWPTVNKADAIRRGETRKLLDAGALRSGEDFEWAANVFQHGAEPNDFLLAHTLAIVAIRRGYLDATWIAAATLDRYLQVMKQPQIYGTQFLNPEGKPTTQDPYDRTLISDAVRRLLAVPDLAAQQEQRQKFDAQRHVGGGGPQP